MDTDELEQKRAFAKALVDCPNDPLKAGFVAFNNNAQMAMKASMQWVTDATVCAEVRRLASKNNDLVDGILPTKEEHCRKLYEIFDDTELNLKDRLIASEQITKIQGFITDNKENTTINNKIMILNNNGTDEQWAEKTRINQENLMKGIITVNAIEQKKE